MNWFANLRTNAKLSISFSLLIAILVASMVLAYQSLQALETSGSSVYRRDFVFLENIMRLHSIENSIRIDMFSLMTGTPSDRQNWLKEIESNEKEADAIFKIIDELPGISVGMQNQTKDLRALIMEYRKVRHEDVIPAIQNNEQDKALNLLMKMQKLQHEKVTKTIQNMVTEAHEKFEESLYSMNEEINGTINGFITIGFFAIILAILLIILLNKYIGKPIKDLAGYAERIADGDLTVQIQSKATKDEVGVLETSFQRMISKLRILTKDISEGVYLLGSSVNEISSSTAQLASSSGETATSVSQTTATIEEVKQTSQVASHKAKIVSDNALKTVQDSEIGKRASDEINEKINQIQNQMNYIAESMVHLSEQGHAISAIINTVDDLAQQSNLLAVNASIEAAKAGEHGKGFSVVAGEVKNLANQSKQATTQVRSILSEIQKATSRAVMATEQGSKAVEEGVKKSGQASASILTLVKSVTDASHVATQIGAVTHQQLVGMEQAVVAMESIKEASIQNLESAKRLEASTYNIKMLGEKLKNIIGQYTFNSDSVPK